MSQIEKIHNVIDEIDKISDSEWINNLEDRKLKELEFHDCHQKIDLKLKEKIELLIAHQ